MLKKALTIAGFDGSGGAGIQADLKTFSAFGCYGMTVLTALPIQNTKGVSNCFALPIEAINQQLFSIFDDITPDVIKIGMLFNKEVVYSVGKFLRRYANNIPIVVDPVMLAKSNDKLLNHDAIEPLINEIISLATIITPNLDEASTLCGYTINTKHKMQQAARNMLNFGCANILVKGGHLAGNNCADLFMNQVEEYWIEATRIDTNNTHGTGCTLSAAIAANLALGLPIKQSCVNAKEYLTNALKSFQHEKIGQGKGPVNHLVNLNFTNSKF
ncbi:MAG: bifunctional hydroxymethylpyrimidine kinase/phosphomethylpyrimidine kinase [Pseudomonadota bacterium]|jgi:hydroxymethylpyrimidine/phosphomethylpyrimidine kinase|nr:bifunctional hydroxymethylpyrimidine kinase/phosphomethylpyrimidine kinase [Burkholderiales bacterium]